METYFTHHCIDDDPITEEILDANHMALPSQIRHRKELIEQITDASLDAYLAEFKKSGSMTFAISAYNAKRIELLRKNSLIN